MGLPTWSGPAVVLASLVSGLLVSLLFGTIGLPYQLFFIICSLAITLLIEARGLFITVASMPLLFGIMTPLTSWLVSQQGISGGQGLSTTAILTAIYPLAEMFPTLIMVTILATIIGVVRIKLLRRNQQHLQVTGEQTRRAQREADRTNATEASRARAQASRARSRRSSGDPELTSHQATVDELIRRNQERRRELSRPVEQIQREVPRAGQVERRQAPPPVPPRRRPSLDDDLYN